MCENVLILPGPLNCRGRLLTRVLDELRPHAKAFTRPEASTVSTSKLPCAKTKEKGLVGRWRVCVEWEY